MQTFTEIKRHLNKPDQTFTCDLLHNEKGHVVLKYHSEKTGLISDIQIPANTTTIAYYWKAKNYVLWQMFDQNEKLIGSLFHICRDVEITDTEVSYIDLILDIWITPGNNIRILDEDELSQAKTNGLVTDEGLALIEKYKNFILADYKNILCQTNPKNIYSLELC